MLTSLTRKSGLRDAFKLPFEWPSSPVTGANSSVSAKVSSQLTYSFGLCRCVMDYAEEIWGVEQVKVPEVHFTEKETAEPETIKKK